MFDYTVLQSRIKQLNDAAWHKTLKQARQNAQKRHYNDLYLAMQIMSAEPVEDWEMCLNLEGVSSVYIHLVQQHLETLV